MEYRQSLLPTNNPAARQLAAASRGSLSCRRSAAAASSERTFRLVGADPAPRVVAPAGRLRNLRPHPLLHSQPSHLSQPRLLSGPLVHNRSQDHKQQLHQEVGGLQSAVANICCLDSAYTFKTSQDITMSENGYSRWDYE